jgi:hypothetical protein
MSNTELTLVIIGFLFALFASAIGGMSLHANKVYQACLDKNSHAPYVIIHEVCKELALK